MVAKTVLIVDDEEASRDICSTLLQHYGYRVLEAVNGEQAVRIAREQRPDLILMDLVLPQLNGWSAGEWIKLDPATSDIPVVALTARASERDQARARVSGFDSYLIKPCKPSRILQEVTRFIGESSAEPLQ